MESLTKALEEHLRFVANGIILVGTKISDIKVSANMYVF